MEDKFIQKCCNCDNYEEHEGKSNICSDENFTIPKKEAESENDCLYFTMEKQREYVIVCNKHEGIVKNALLFWGKKTENNTKRRSFGGYTSDLSICEKYTRTDLEEWRKGNEENYPFFEEVPKKESSNGRLEFMHQDNVLITIDQLKRLGYRQLTIMI